MLWNRLVIGYHGCDASLAKKVVCKSLKLTASNNDYDWLGSGTYFWEGSNARAMEWAKAAAKRKGSKVKKPGVLGAVIDLGNCLNLVESEYLQIVREAYTGLERVHEASGESMPVNTGKDMALRKLDRAVFEFLHYSREQEGQPPFETVRAFFVEGDELYPSAGIRQMDHIQICVRNPAQILGLFLP